MTAMPSLAHQLLTMAQQNAWANHRLLAACAKLTVAIVLSTLAGCRTVTAPLPDTFVCAHCACFSAMRTVSAPVLCETLGRDIMCCLADSS